MRTMFRVVLSLVAVCSCSTAPFAVAADCAPDVISNRPECLASGVYVGDDDEMPLDGTFKIAFETSPILMRVPKTIEESVALVVDSLPHWYLVALKSSSGDSECDVIVNRVSYSAVVVNWLWAQWNMSDPSSELRQDFSAMGFNSQSEVQQAMILGICEYSKNGRDRALKKLRERGAAG